jgi:6-phospho-beta-glucosidase
VLLDIARDVADVAPDARLINFTNPSGLVTEALLKHTAVPTIGLCNSPLGFAQNIAARFGAAPEQIRLDYVGLNHLSWIRGVTLHGRDVFEEVLANAIARARTDESLFSPELLETLSMIPSYYLTYYYNHDRIVAEQQRAAETRGEQVREIDAHLLALYADPDLEHKPELLQERGGAHYATAALALISAIHHNTGELQIVNTRNNGALPDLPPDCVVELPALINGRGAQAVPISPLPPVIRGLVQAVKAYEELTVVAAVEGDGQAALQALLAHPLVPSFDVAQGLWTAIKGANGAYLPQFERRR